MQKILITGGAGYIGSHTVHFLISMGVSPTSIIVFDNLERGHKEFIPDDVQFIKGDLRDAKKIKQVFQENKVDAVIHFAALAYVGESMSEPGLYFSNNISGGINLLEGMKEGGCKIIIFSSTCSTYGLVQTATISESHPQNPINPYAESKLTFEKILKWYEKIYSIQYICLRYFNAAGAGFGIGEWHEPETHLIPIAIEANLGLRQELEIYGDDYPTKDGTCIRDYIHITDLASAHFKALEYLRKGGPSDQINLGTAVGASVRDVVVSIEKISGRKVPLRIVPRREGDPAVLVANSDKAKKVLHWEPYYSLDDTVESAWKWTKILWDKVRKQASGSC